MATTSIEWTMSDDGTPGKTWNPIRGCTKISPGCLNCYAMHTAARFIKPGQPYEGLAKRGPVNWTGAIRLVPEKLAEPLTWRKPARVFVNSMSDLFHEDVPDDYIDRVFAVMGVAHWHTFQVLTKRADRMEDYFRETWQMPAKPAHRAYGFDIPEQAAYVEDRWDRINRACDDIPSKLLGDRCWDAEESLIGRPAWPRNPYPNVWLGVSVEDQARADERIPHLLNTPAAVRFLSVEPLLGPVDLFSHTIRVPGQKYPKVVPDTWRSGMAYSLDWCIVGGESGQGARPCEINWIRSVINQCQGATIPVFCKQLGANVTGEWSEGGYGPNHFLKDRFKLRNKKGGDPSEWPPDLRVRQFPKQEQPA